MLIIVKYGVYEDRSHIFIKERFNKMVIEDGKFPESGTNIPFYNIIEMRNILLENRKG